MKFIITLLTSVLVPVLLMHVLSLAPRGQEKLDTAQFSAEAVYYPTFLFKIP